MRLSITKIPLLLLPLLWCTFCIAQKNKYPLAAVAFYNVENLFDPTDDKTKGDDPFTPNGSYQYTQELYGKKLHNLAFVLAQLATDQVPSGPALIGLAEVENRQVLEDLVAMPALKKRAFKIVHFDSPDPRGIDVALLYRANVFQLIEARTLPMNTGINGRRERTRDILYVKGKMDQDTIHILVNHWPSRKEGESNSERKRMVAAEMNKKKIDDIIRTQPEAKIILMGDLNDNPIDKSIAQILDAQGDKNQVRSNGLFNPWWQFYKNGRGTSIYKNSWHLFDQILVSAAWLKSSPKSWKYSGAEIFDRKFLQNPFGKKKGQPHRSFSGTRWIDGFSDHFPTLIYLSRTN